MLSKVVALHTLAIHIVDRGVMLDAKERTRVANISRACGICVSSEETTDAPKPRIPLPRPLSRYTKEGGVPLREQHFADTHGDRAMHHPLASCIVWDCGHGMLESMPYHEAPVWAQQET